MIMSMCSILCVTNRHLVKGDFLKRLEKIASAGVTGVILREKDMEEQEYRMLAEKAEKICQKYQVPLILHTYWKLARELEIRYIHLPYSVFCAMKETDKRWFWQIGVSIHTVEEAIDVQSMGASYVTAGHIFPTDCKKGVPAKGLLFLEMVCHKTEIPVYAIGGITPAAARDCRKAGAAGVCLMSSLMEKEEIDRYVCDFGII